MKALSSILMTVGMVVGLWALPAQAREKADVGKEAADDYFLSREGKAEKHAAHRSPARADSPRHMMIQLGTFIDDRAYRWGEKSSDEGVGDLNLAITYRMGEWVNSMDLSLRVDFQGYELKGERAIKMGLLPLVTFPDAKSGFPLYFGAGAGLGVFFRQVGEEGPLAFDYQLVAGARFMNLFDGMGLSLETGLKNHAHLLDDGQFSGAFVTAGTVFNF